MKYIKKTLNWVKNKIMYPFQHDLAFFLTLFLINYIPDLCIFIVTGPPDYIFYFAFYSYITTYVIELISNINLFIGKIVKPVILAGYIIFALVNLYCIIFLHCRLSHDIIQIIIGTNFVEVIEYFETYINYKLILGGGIITAIIIIFFVFMKRIRLNSYSSKISFCMFGFLLLSWIVVENLNSAIKKDLSYGWLFNVDDIIDVKMHPTNPKLEFNEGNSSSNIIVIFGESFAPSHSSLYGYDKITNPLLNKKLEEKDLILFTNVKSPAAGTNRAFMYILNTKLLEDGDSIKWYKYPNLIEVLSASGYKTYWFSTQKEKGMYHNLSSGFSRICDEAHFTSNLTDGYKYDEELLNYEINESDSPSVVFYHLMGQHPSFRERYPDGFNFFKSTDYESEHPQILADYDNATLYNDYVVNSIIDKYKDMDAIVFYFSDHGLDIFETDANYAGHAKNTPKSQEIGKKIPFMVYMSPLFQRNHPGKTEKIRNAEDREFCTDKFIFVVMDVEGIKFADNDDVHKYSLFSEN